MFLVQGQREEDLIVNVHAKLHTYIHTRMYILRLRLASTQLCTLHKFHFLQLDADIILCGSGSAPDL